MSRRRARTVQGQIMQGVGTLIGVVVTVLVMIILGATMGGR